jgi:sec-independent protein translocase protein TatA
MPNLGGWEFVILIGVLVLLFGAKRLPDMARSIGQSARVFKGEMKGMKNDEGKAAEPPAASTPAPPPAAPAELPPAATPPAPNPASTGAQEPSRAAGQGPTGAK